MKQTALSLSVALMAFGALSQNVGVLKCGSDNYYEQHLVNHPEVAAERNQQEEFIANFVANYSGDIEKYTSINIPVVFHVNDPTNPQKVTSAQVQSALAILNEDYTATNSDISSIRPEFTSLIADMDINFCLATIDPNGNPTTGITYHTNNYNGREPDGYGTAVKSVSSWPGNKYLNIWIVNYIEDDGSLYNSGWAYLPDSWVASNNLDGIVYNHRYLGYTGSSEVSGPSSWQAEMARVLTHEVGHYLDLHHTFKNYCSSPGDYVDDTPYVYYHGSNNCDQLGIFCNSTTVVMDQNYMDYTPCPSMFSTGQKTRVIAALNSSLAGRNNLWTSSNLIATGCQSTATITEIANNDALKLYPNPVQNELNIELSMDAEEVTSFHIINTVGQEVMTVSRTFNNNTSIDISSLPDGIYLIQIENASSSLTHRFVKTK